MVFTSSYDSRKKLEASLSDVDEYIIKPMNVNDICDNISKLMKSLTYNSNNLMESD